MDTDMSVNSTDCLTCETVCMRASVYKSPLASLLLRSVQAKSGVPSWKTSPSFQQAGSC